MFPVAGEPRMQTNEKTNEKTNNETTSAPPHVAGAGSAARSVRTQSKKKLKAVKTLLGKTLFGSSGKPSVQHPDGTGRQ